MKKIIANEYSSLDIPESAARTKTLSFFVLGLGIALCVFGVASLSFSKEINAKSGVFSKKIEKISKQSEQLKTGNLSVVQDMDSEIKIITDEVRSLYGKSTFVASLDIKSFVKTLEGALSQASAILVTNGHAEQLGRLQEKLSEAAPYAQALNARLAITKAQFSSPAIQSFHESSSRFLAYAESSIGFNAVAKIEYDLRNMSYLIKQVRDAMRPQDYAQSQKEIEYIVGSVYQQIPNSKVSLNREDIENIYSVIKNVQGKNSLLLSESDTAVYISYGLIAGSFFIIFMGIMLSSTAVTSSIANINERSKRSLVRYTNLQSAIMEMIASLKAASKGDLTVFSKTDNDESADLADIFNQTLVGFKNFITRMRKVSSQVDDTVRDSRVNAEKYINLASAQNEALAKTIETLKESLDIIQGIDSDTRATTFSTNSALNVIENGSLAIQESAFKMDSIRQNIQSTSKHIKQLGERSQEIGEIVDILGNFSEQVNVLSLNAAIEASRAGEKGKGFKVIAEEISALSDRTEESLKKIALLVENIQSDTRGAINAMELSTSNVVGSAYVTEVAGSSLNSIRAVVDILDSMMLTIANNSASQKHKIESLIDQAHNLSTRNNEIVSGFRSLNDGVLSIKTVTDNISNFSKEFKT